MRNIFDQYDSPENRLTHALGCCLSRDRELLRSFVQWATGRQKLSWTQLRIAEQQVPGTPVDPSHDEENGLPDLWIYGDGGWSLIVESKVAAGVSAEQLTRHQRTARRNGFSEVDLLVLAPKAPASRNSDVIYRTWPDVYCWARKHASKSEWASCLAEYMEVAEGRMMADGYLGDRPLTVFDGIPFGPEHPYSYREAKRLLKLALAELRKRPNLHALGIDPEGAGRPAITGREGASVWDFLPLRSAHRQLNFTSCPHLTLAIGVREMRVIVSLPSAVVPAIRRRLTDLSQEDFFTLVSEVERGVSEAVRLIKGAHPLMEVLQRHYPSQRSQPITDADLRFDLRTAVGTENSSVKRQPQWLEAAFSALVSKRSNLQIGIGAALPYGDPRLHSRETLDVIAAIWCGCSPWLRTVME